MSQELAIFIFIGCYFTILLLPGYIGTWVTLATREDYFFASRSLSTLHLFMAYLLTQKKLQMNFWSV